MPPNILLVITDQQSRFAQSAAGNEWVRTPHLDSLSASGVRFTRAYCASPVCSPSRASLATGRPPHQTGLMANGMPWTASMPELCGHFLSHGYDVGWVGIRPGNPPESSGDLDSSCFCPMVSAPALAARATPPSPTRPSATCAGRGANGPSSSA